MRSMVADGDTILDGRIHVGADRAPEIAVTHLTREDVERLEFWVGVMLRRRAELVHDLSGPTTGVLAAIETVLEYDPIPESSRSLLQEGRGGILRVTQLLDDRRELLASQANVREGALRTFVQSGIAIFRDTFDPLGERIDARIEVIDEVIRVDASRLERALAVLLINAWRFRLGQRMTVHIRASVHGRWIRVEVEDHGVGIYSDTDLLRAGELGFSGRGGAGLGLFSLRWALRGRGGIVLRRREPGLAATFFLRAS